MPPTQKQLEKEMENAINIHPKRINVYNEIHLELQEILTKTSFKISHGFNSSKDWYEMVWYPHQRIERLFIRVKTFDGTTLGLMFSTDLDFKNPVSVTLEKELLFSWLSCLVDEIFVQAI